MLRPTGKLTNVALKKKQRAPVMAALEFRCSSLRLEHHLRTEKVYRVFNEEGGLASLHSGAAGSDWQNLGVPRETDRFSGDSNSRQQRRKVTIERLARLEGKLSK